MLRSRERWHSGRAVACLTAVVLATCRLHGMAGSRREAGIAFRPRATAQHVIHTRGRFALVLGSERATCPSSISRHRAQASAPRWAKPARPSAWPGASRLGTSRARTPGPGGRVASRVAPTMPALRCGPGLAATLPAHSRRACVLHLQNRTRTRSTHARTHARTHTRTHPHGKAVEPSGSYQAGHETDRQPSTRTDALPTESGQAGGPRAASAAAQHRPRTSRQGDLPVSQRVHARGEHLVESSAGRKPAPLCWAKPVRPSARRGSQAWARRAHGLQALAAGAPRASLPPCLRCAAALA